MTTPAPCYRIIRHRDRREGVWFDVEYLANDGGRAIVATLDTLAEARDLVRRMERANARPTAADLEALGRAIRDTTPPAAGDAPAKDF
jgi:hypothetical protein